MEEAGLGAKQEVELRWEGGLQLETGARLGAHVLVTGCQDLPGDLPWTPQSWEICLESSQLERTGLGI